MTGKADYTDEEWNRLRRAPFVAGTSISLADPGGPIELSHETIATLKEASTPPSREQLLIEVSQDIMSMVNQKQNPLAGFKPDSSTPAGTWVLSELSAVNDILRAKAIHEEAEASRRWLLDVAQGAANAAKEGGFMGFGAVRVSEGEQGMLEKLRSTLGVN
jgi:transcription antitermination factor NusG